mgnify:CR=1 FL=1
MAQKPKSRAAARKVKDKWKSKVWYSVLAPDMFDRKVLGEIPADDPVKLNERVVESTLHEISGDFSKQHVKVSFKVYDTRGTNCYTRFIGHDLTSDYVRRLTRRKKSKTDGIFDVETRDNYLFRIKPMAIADTRIQSAQQTIIRGIMKDTIHQVADGKTHSEFVSSILSGELAKLIAKNSKVIHPLSRVEIRRSQVLRPGELPPIIEEEEIEAEVLEEEEDNEEEELKLEAEAEVEAEEMLARDESDEEPVDEPIEESEELSDDFE